MYKIEKGKRVFYNQHKNQKFGCNVRLLKEHEMNDSIFPVGWCLEMDPATVKRWIKEGKAEAFSYTETTKRFSSIVDQKGENIVVEENKLEDKKTK